MGMATATFKPRAVRRGLWFPCTLAGLLVLLAPGLVLLVVSLCGGESAANAWLQEHLGITYHFGAPAGLAIALLLLPPALVLLYFLKLRRKPLPVPSTFLWRKSIEDLHVNSLFQWLRDNVLLLLQLLIVLVLVYAALGIQFHGSTAVGKYYILIIDNSASMAVADVSPSRLEVAKEEALREIDAHADGDAGMVIAFNSRAALLQSYTTDKALLRQAVNSIRPTHRPTRIDEALTLADSLANPLRSTEDASVRPTGPDPGRPITFVAPEGRAAEVLLFSDGRFPDVPSFSSGNLDVQYHRVGQSGPENVDNIGIVALSALRNEQDTSHIQVFVRVLNFRPAKAEVQLELEWRQPGQEGFTLRQRELHLPPRKVTAGNAERHEQAVDAPGEGVATFDLGEIDDAANAVVHARLRDLHDQFPLDDEAWLVVGVTRQARVLIVTPGNEVLRDFFDQEATQKVARVTYLAPADLGDEAKYRRPVQRGDFDLVIFDRCAPESEEAMPQANAFLIDAVPPPWRRADMPPLKDAPILNPSSRHPLMRHLTALNEIAYSEAFRFDLKDPRVPPRTPRLLETDRETAVLFLLERRAFRDLVLTFPLVNAKGQWTTNWNLRLSFPVFLRNVLFELGHVRDAPAEENVQPGEVKTLRPDAAVKEVKVIGPDGMRQTIARGARPEFLYNNTDEPGTYRAEWAGGERRFVVNLLDAEESNTQPRDEVHIGAQHLASAAPRRQAHDIWKWCTVGALLLFALEWAAYNRRVFW
jgi:hypothetical protein